MTIVTLPQKIQDLWNVITPDGALGMGALGQRHEEP